jgi:hypothetical protein
MYLVKKVKTKTETTTLGENNKSIFKEQWVEVELHDAATALTQLGRYHKLFTDKIEQHNHLHVEDLEIIMDMVYGKS